MHYYISDNSVKTSKNFPGPAMTRLGPDYDKTTSRQEYDYNIAMTITMTIITMVVAIYLLIRYATF